MPWSQSCLHACPSFCSSISIYSMLNSSCKQMNFIVHNGSELTVVTSLAPQTLHLLPRLRRSFSFLAQTCSDQGGKLHLWIDHILLIGMSSALSGLMKLQILASSFWIYFQFATNFCLRLADCLQSILHPGHAKLCISAALYSSPP